MRRTATAAVLVLLAATLQLWVASPARALALPPSFQLVDYPTGQAPFNLVDYAWLPDGALLTAGKDGTITFVPPGSAPRVVGKVPSVRANGDHGMLGFALANDYPTTGHVFLAYDKLTTGATTGFGMVEEWTLSPAAAPTTLTKSRTLVDGSATSPQLAQLTPNHGMDTVLVAPDDTLFVTIGDDTRNNGDPQTLRSQDTNQPYGKVLHLAPSGAGVASNPFFSAAQPSSWRSRVYAYGMRNPFRLMFDPRNGTPYVGDVGWNETEEINALEPGFNGGWPCYEGTARTTFSNQATCQTLYSAGSAQPPLWSYPHAGAGAAVVAGMVYTGTAYPGAYRNSHFFGDYTRTQMWTLATDTNDQLIRLPEPQGFGTDVGGPVAFHPGPNGDVTYADLLSGNVRRLVYSGENRDPVAAFTISSDAATRTVTFTATDSYDLDGDELTFGWALGDGDTATGPTVVHTYDDSDPVQVTLTATDQLGATDTATATVHAANHTPELVVEAPTTTFAVGEAVELSAEATDEEDGELEVSWDTALLHCPFAGSCHRHPEDTEVGPSYSRDYTDHGADTTMLVTARVQDSLGTVATSTFEAKPTLRTVAVNSPVPVSINGVIAASAPVVPGSDVQVSAPTSSSYWRFTGWSDGGAAQHAFTMPDADRTLTASYVTAIDQRYAALGGSSSFLGNPTGTEYDIAGGRGRNYAGGRLYWSEATGAHTVAGAVLTKYLAKGGPASIGFPTTDGQAVTGGRANFFTGGRIYWSSGTGAHLLTGPILTKYLATGGATSYGLPSTDVTTVTGGSYAHFTGTRSIFWSAATQAHLVFGPIRTRYANAGYQRSCLRFPTSDRLTTTTGYRNTFTGGTITLVTRTGSTTLTCR